MDVKLKIQIDKQRHRYIYNNLEVQINPVLPNKGKIKEKSCEKKLKIVSKYKYMYTERGNEKNFF